MSTDLLRPYLDLDGIFESVEYRPNQAQPFEALDIDGDMAAKLVYADDLRTIPQHQFRIKLDMGALKGDYATHKAALKLVLILRDTTLRREIVLASYPIDAVPETIDLDRAQLKSTGLRDALTVQFVVVAAESIRGAMFPAQRASRVAELQVILKNNSGGASFPYKRVSAEELKNKGLPSETGIHLELICDGVELLRQSDTPIRSLFEVWLHEDIWSAIQNDHALSSAGMRTSAITVSVANLLFSSVTTALKSGHAIEEGSSIGQLLAYIEKQGSLPEGQLRKRFQDDPSLHILEPWLQNAFRFVTNASRVEEEQLA